ncbi:hypothetical protein STENM36S_08632 [Streptomyces tendae]
MTGGFEGPGTMPATTLTAVVARVGALADRLGVPHGEIFDIGRLSASRGSQVRRRSPARRPSGRGTEMSRPGSCNTWTCCAVPG